MLWLRAASRWQHRSSMQRGISACSHTKRPRMHIELSDLLRRPGQWCFKSSTTLSSLQNTNCSDRIGSEMCNGLKIGLLFWYELNNLVLFMWVHKTSTRKEAIFTNTLTHYFYIGIVHARSHEHVLSLFPRLTTGFIAVVNTYPPTQSTSSKSLQFITFSRTWWLHYPQCICVTQEIGSMIWCGNNWADTVAESGWRWLASMKWKMHPQRGRNCIMLWWNYHSEITLIQAEPTNQYSRVKQQQCSVFNTAKGFIYGGQYLFFLCPVQWDVQPSAERFEELPNYSTLPQILSGFKLVIFSPNQCWLEIIKAQLPLDSQKALRNFSHQTCGKDVDEV